MAKQKFHIHQLSRLVFAYPPDWMRILEELEAGRQQMFWSYKPLRNGAFNLLRSKGAQRDRIYQDVEVLAEKAGGAKCARANVSGLQVFESKFAPQIGAAKENLMGQSSRGVDFANIELIGGPHFSIADRAGNTKFVYLHPSNWKDEQVQVFCELLTVIIEKRFQAVAADLWFLDLRGQVRLPWPKSKQRLRRKCEQTAKLLAFLKGANFGAEDENI
jgi:hypothetical protein